MIFYGLNLDIFDFSSLCATLKAFSVRSIYRIAMVDNAFERIDVGLFKHGIDYDVSGACIAL